MQLVDDNFSTICLRQGTLSGYSPRMRFDLFINTMYMKAMMENKIVVNNPVIWRPLLAMTDAVKCYIKALEAPPEVSGTFNVLTLNLQVGNAADHVKRYFLEKHGVDVEQSINNIQDRRNYRVSNRKAREVLGIDFNGSLTGILDELDVNLGKDFNFDQDHFYNIQMFKRIFKE